LLDDKDGNYVIRVVGGQVTVPQSAVRKIEQDDLTVAQVEQRESERREVLAQANQRRSEFQAVEASARRAAVEAGAASQRRNDAAIEIFVDLSGVLGEPTSGGRQETSFDPVLHKTDLSGLAAIVDEHMRRSLEAEIGSDAARFADRGRTALINFSSSVPPIDFRTYDAALTRGELRDMQYDIHAYVKRQVQRAAHQRPETERMNLPRRAR